MACGEHDHIAPSRPAREHHWDAPGDCHATQPTQMRHERAKARSHMRSSRHESRRARIGFGHWPRAASPGTIQRGAGGGPNGSGNDTAPGFLRGLVERRAPWPREDLRSTRALREHGAIGRPPASPTRTAPGARECPTPEYRPRQSGSDLTVAPTVGRAGLYRDLPRSGYNFRLIGV